MAQELFYDLQLPFSSILMKFYADLEFMDSLDKYILRYNICTLFRTLWSNPLYKEVIVNESRSRKEFIPFALTLINDASILLEETLESLKRISAVQEDLSHHMNWNSQSLEVQQERIQQLSKDQETCPALMRLGKESMEIIHYLSVELKDSFLRPELVHRLSNGLVYNFVLLCSQKCAEIEVKDPEKFGWDPRRFLLQAVEIFLNLENETGQLVDAIMSDEKKEEFDDAANRLLEQGGAGILTEDKLNRFCAFVNRTKKVTFQTMQFTVVGYLDESNSKYKDSSDIITEIVESPSIPIEVQIEEGEGEVLEQTIEEAEQDGLISPPHSPYPDIPALRELEAKYPCPVCGKLWRKGWIKRHIEYAHNGKIHRCHMCDSLHKKKSAARNCCRLVAGYVRPP